MESVSPDLVRARRPRVEHAQIVASADLKRFGDLGGELHTLLHGGRRELITIAVIASVQPTHACVCLGAKPARLTADRWLQDGRHVVCRRQAGTHMRLLEVQLEGC